MTNRRFNESVSLVVSALSQYQRHPSSVQNNLLDHGESNRQQSSGSCPEKNGRFPVPSQCDAYIECIDGVAEEKLCPEGLLFNPEARFNYPCGYPIDVDCNGRPNRRQYYRIIISSLSFLCFLFAALCLQFLWGMIWQGVARGWGHRFGLNPGDV